MVRQCCICRDHFCSQLIRQSNLSAIYFTAMPVWSGMLDTEVRVFYMYYQYFQAVLQRVFNFCKGICSGTVFDAYF